MKDTRLYLIHILERLDRFLTYVADGQAGFFASPQVQDAVIRNLEVIGEATKRIPIDARRRCAYPRRTRPRRHHILILRATNFPALLRADAQRFASIETWRAWRSVWSAVTKVRLNTLAVATRNRSAGSR